MVTIRIRYKDREETVTRVRAPRVGSTVNHEGHRGWLVISCESVLTHRVAPFQMVIPNEKAA